MILTESTPLWNRCATALHAQRALGLLDAAISAEDSDTSLLSIPLGHMNSNEPLRRAKSDIKPEPCQISWNAKSKKPKILQTRKCLNSADGDKS